MACVGSFSVERLSTGEPERLKDLRLRALAESPLVFGTKLAEAVTWPMATWRRQLEQMTTFVAVLSPSETRPATDIGMVRCVLHPEADTASLISLWVAKTSRRQGVARELVDTVVRYAREQKMGRVVLDVVETNTSAITLYRRYGFVPNGERVVFPESCHNMSELQFELLL